MKRLAITIFALVAFTTMMAQGPQSPIVFRSQTEHLLYQAEHPELIKTHHIDAQRGMTAYSQKLDSVIGSDNFDRSRWKNVYSYTEESEHPSDAFEVETNYKWEDMVWMPYLRTENHKNAETGLMEHADSYRWTGEDWERYFQTDYQYNDLQLLESVTMMNLHDSVWEGANRTVFEYDADGNLLLRMNYVEADSGWVESSKYEYLYNADGLLDTCLYSTIRNGSWRETERKIYSYDDQQCVSLLGQRKGGWGPNGGNWMDSYRYEFDYQDGKLLSETYYTGGWAWFSQEMSLDSKNEYHLDDNGNLAMKTGSVYNEVDWIVRDVYENNYDLSVDAATILGLQTVWESTLSNGMGYVLGEEMPLMSQWNSCIIASPNLDTELHLYYSGFASIGETESVAFDAFGTEGRIVVRCPELCDLTVYDLLGRVVATRSQTLQAEFALRPGLYVVSNGTQRVKTIVR